MQCVSECDQVKLNNFDTCCEQVQEVRTTKQMRTGLKRVNTPLLPNGTQLRLKLNGQLNLPYKRPFKLRV
jgi:hypothetical protein